MENKRAFSLIKKIDHYLLKNHPVTWSSRIHTAGLYGIGFSILVALLSFIVPNDPRNSTTIYYWIILISIISLLAFVFWMIYLLRFNVFKRYGSWRITDTVKTFAFYFIITFIIISWPFIPPVIESVRANIAYSSNELTKDINEMNIKVCQLESEIISTKFKRDTLQVDHYVKGIQRKDPDHDEAVDNNGNVYGYYYVDTATLNIKVKTADSVNKLSESMYVIYDCPDYLFIDEMSTDDHGSVKLFTSMELYRMVLKNKQPVDKENLRKDLGKLFIKYSRLHDPSTLSTGIVRRYYNQDQGYMSKINEKYDLDFVNRALNNITDKKYRWDEGMVSLSINIAYYFTLVLSLLVLIYRHTTRRTFFLSLLAGVVLSILTGIFIAMTSHGDSVFGTWIIAYFMIFILLSAFIFNSKTRHAIPGIGLNFLVLMTPFIPLVITSIYYDSLRKKYWRNDEIWAEYGHYFRNERFHYDLAQIGGFLLLILLLATLYQMAYKKWFSLPEQ
ncbi:MAG TPA: hypothetical protein VIS75_08495 [Chitinophagaceae bacterium]